MGGRGRERRLGDRPPLRPPRGRASHSVCGGGYRRRERPGRRAPRDGAQVRRLPRRAAVGLIVRKLTMTAEPKGWLAGPWESGLPIGIGFASAAIDAPHRHERTTEVYLASAGAATAVVDGVEVLVRAGDVLIVEPQEVRSIRHATPDYRCFVVHAGGGGDDRIDINPD